MLSNSVNRRYLSISGSSRRASELVGAACLCTLASHAWQRVQPASAPRSFGGSSSSSGRSQLSDRGVNLRNLVGCTCPNTDSARLAGRTQIRLASTGATPPLPLPSLTLEVQSCLQPTCPARSAFPAPIRSFPHAVRDSFTLSSGLITPTSSAPILTRKIASQHHFPFLFDSNSPFLSVPGKEYYSTSREVAAMGASKIDGTAIAKRIRENLHAEIQEKKKINPRYVPSLKIIQGEPHSCSCSPCVCVCVCVAPVSDSVFQSATAVTLVSLTLTSPGDFSSRSHNTDSAQPHTFA